jgi:predicted NBD/HSP70 family sugar kinase
MATDTTSSATEGPSIRDPAGGVTQSGLRDHNERLVLSLIHRHGSLPAADIARRAGLSAQTISIILRALEKDGLLARGDPIRGKVGKPSVPMALNPDGILSAGLNVGRRSSDLVLIDVAGTVRAHIKRTYPYPTPEAVIAFLAEGFSALGRMLATGQMARLAGLGIAAPFELWNWLDVVNAPKDDMLAWRDFDLAAECARVSALPVVMQNDATAACTAEHVFGRGREFSDYAYFFIGSFVGGGIVLNDAVHAGRSGNAGAFGSLLVPDGRGGARQLLKTASIYLLERQLEAAGHNPATIWDQACDWSDFGPPLESWIAATATNLAVAAVSVSAVIDFERVLIDVNAPPPIRRRIVDAVQAQVTRLDTQGIDRPVVIEASVGRNARAIGAAALPILERYFLSSRLVA